MLAALRSSAELLDESRLQRHDHALIVLPRTARLTEIAHLPLLGPLERVLKRRKMKPDDLAKTPVTVETGHGGLCAYVMLDRNKPRFEQLSVLRRAIDALLEEQPTSLAIGVFGDEALREALAREALYVAWINGALLPARKKKDQRHPLSAIKLYGTRRGDNFDTVAAIARANVLARELTVLPPNELTPGTYRQRLRKLAREQGWRIEEYDLKYLRKAGAGAFAAVAQGSAEEDAAIVHLSYQPKGAVVRRAGG